MSQIDVFEQRTIAAINDKTAFASIPPVAVGDKLIQLAELVRRYTVTDYDNSAYDNSGYPVESLVVYGNILYQSLVDSNKIIPGTDITKWQVILDASGSSIDVSQFVKITTDQTVAGIKTFSSSPLVPVATQAAQAVQFSQLQTLIDDIPDYIPPTSTTTTTTTTTTQGQSFIVQNQTDGSVNVNGSQVSAGGSLTIPNN